VEDLNIKEKILEFLLSDIKRRMTLSILVAVGGFLMIISLLGKSGSYQFTMALGVSLVVGVFIGFYVGNKIGWPLGFWVGLLGGLLGAPLATLLFGDGISAYYASFLGPIVGALVGRWTELNDKRRLEEDIDRITK